MAKSKEKTINVNDEEKGGELAVITPHPVAIVSAAQAISDIAIPQEFAEAEEIESLLPVCDFQNANYGAFVMGLYNGCKEGVGPHKSTIWYVRTTPEEIVAVWGNTILDDKMRNAHLKLNDAILIQYIGEIPTDKGNPAKDFRLRVKRSK